MSGLNPLIIVGMSGGVDSSVAALLLKRQGLRIAGMFMKNWEEDDSSKHCTATEDLDFAQRTCDLLDIPLHTANFAAEYWDNVFAHFLNEYKAGRTPNPDILCNSEIKFKVFLEYAKVLGADYIATGHYAKVITTSNMPTTNLLCKAKDENKDQSYFLYALNQEQLRHAIFPLADLHKTEVRRIAQEAKLPSYKKKDSTGICFIGERKFKNFLQNYLPAKSGNIVTIDGKIIGQHDGLMFYTIGQRQGLKIGGRADSNSSPWYVAYKNIAENELVVVQDSNNPALFSQQLGAIKLTWIQGVPPATKFDCNAKIRYRQADQACTVTLAANQPAKDYPQDHSQDYEPDCLVTFATPQRAVTPGQSIVFYQGDVCLGGGIIR